jgi:hypothetical protein
LIPGVTAPGGAFARWRTFIHDYRSDIKQGFFERLEALYRDLKYNYDKHLGFPEASEFYYSEMEMRRKS